MVDPPMAPSVLREVILGVLEDWNVDVLLAAERLDGLIEALTESWLKDRERAARQAMTTTGSSLSGGES